MTERQHQQLQLSGQAYRNFVNSIKSKESKIQYIYALSKYMRFLKVSDVDQLLSKSDKPRLLEAQLIDFIVTLRENEGLSYGAINGYKCAITKFYVMNDVLLNNKKISSYLGENMRKHTDRSYSREEIHKLLEISDERMKVIVLLLASSGMRLAALSGLSIKHLKKIQKEDNNVALYQILVYERTKDEYYTFCTPEAALAVDSYLQYRERFGEKITPDSPLLREQFDRNDIISIKKPRRLERDAISTLLVRTLHKAGLQSVKHETEDNRAISVERKEVARANGFRKFANTVMIKSKVNGLAKEMLLGHTTGLENNYYRPSIDDILTEYLKAVDSLTINEENRLRKQVEYLKIEKSEIEKLREEVEEFRIIKPGLDVLANEIKKLKETVGL